MRHLTLLLAALGSAATFQVHVGVWDDTAVRYGGMAEVVPLVYEQFAELNDNLARAGVEAGFVVTRVERFHGDPCAWAWREHPGCDLYVCYNEGGPAGGYVGRSGGIPIYAIGHNLRHEGMGVFSDWGDDFLRHEIGHFRGVQDLYHADVSPGDNPVLPVGYRSAYAGTMRYPYGNPSWSPYAVRVMNGYGADARLPYPDEAGGHLYGLLPPLIVLRLEGAGDAGLTGGALSLHRVVEGRVEAAPSFEAVVGEGGEAVVPAHAFGRPGDGGVAGLFIVVRGERDGVLFGWLELPAVHEAVWAEEGARISAGLESVDVPVRLSPWEG